MNITFYLPILFAFFSVAAMEEQEESPLDLNAVTNLELAKNSFCKHSNSNQYDDKDNIFLRQLAQNPVWTYIPSNKALTKIEGLVTQNITVQTIKTLEIAGKEKENALDENPSLFAGLEELEKIRTFYATTRIKSIKGGFVLCRNKDALTCFSNYFPLYVLGTGVMEDLVKIYVDNKDKPESTKSNYLVLKYQN